MNGGLHFEDYNGATSSSPLNGSTSMMGPLARGGPGHSPPLSTGGVLQYADGPSRVPAADGPEQQGGDSDMEPQDCELRRRMFFSSSSSSSSSSGCGGSRFHLQSGNAAKQGHYSNHGNHQPSNSQHVHMATHVSSSHSSHSAASQEGRRRGRRKRSSAGPAPAPGGSPKRRSFPGISSSNHSSGSPLNINSMVSG